LVKLFELYDDARTCQRQRVRYVGQKMRSTCRWTSVFGSVHPVYRCVSCYTGMLQSKSAVVVCTCK